MPRPTFFIENDAQRRVIKFFIQTHRLLTIEIILNYQVVFIPIAFLFYFGKLYFGHKIGVSGNHRKITTIVIR